MKAFLIVTIAAAFLAEVLKNFKLANAYLVDFNNTRKVGFAATVAYMAGL